MLEVFYFFRLSSIVRPLYSKDPVSEGRSSRCRSQSRQDFTRKHTYGHEVQSESFILLSISRIQATQPAQMVQ